MTRVGGYESEWFRGRQIQSVLRNAQSRATPGRANEGKDVKRSDDGRTIGTAKGRDEEHYSAKRKGERGSF